MAICTKRNAPVLILAGPGNHSGGDALKWRFMTFPETSVVFVGKNESSYRKRTQQTLTGASPKLAAQRWLLSRIIAKLVARFIDY